MCKHYVRHCSFVSPCCGKIYDCRLCHDYNEDENILDVNKAHKIDRFAINEIICKKCNLKQVVSNLCKGCNAKFGNYYCSVCHLFDDDTSKGQFHCIKCGICRVGFKENFVHCDTCQTCMPSGEHKCLVKDIKSDCPICFESLFNYRDTVHPFDCGHACHSKCFKEYIKTNYKCPICSKSLFNINEYIEQQVMEADDIPEEWIKEVEILCNDCNKKSKTMFHPIAMKCCHCNSYNSKMI